MKKVLMTLGVALLIPFATTALADEAVKDIENKVNKLADIDENHRKTMRQLDQITNQQSLILEQEKAWESQGAKKLSEIEKQLKTEAFADKARKLLATVDEELKKIGYQVDYPKAIRINYSVR